MSKMFHGTNQQYALEILKNGLNEGSYITSEFEFAASYALRQGGNATILVFEDVDFYPPDEPAFDVEFVTKSKVFPTAKLSPTFDSSNLPEDYYDLNDDISERKYPQFFDKKSWVAS